MTSNNTQCYCRICDTTIAYNNYISHLEDCEYRARRTLENLDLYRSNNLLHNIQNVNIRSHDVLHNLPRYYTNFSGRDPINEDRFFSRRVPLYNINNFLRYNSALSDTFNTFSLFSDNSRSETDDEFLSNDLRYLSEIIGSVIVGIDNIDMVSRLITYEDIEFDITTCSICLEQFSQIHQADPQKRYRLLVCNHTFCDTCITTWLSSSKKCPNCNIDLDTYAYENVS